MWKVLGEKVDGTSHRTLGLPCQDAYSTSVLLREEREYLIVACSDGAGSAAKAEIGSQIGANAVASAAAAFLHAGGELGIAGADAIRDWFQAGHQAIADEAGKLQVEPRELACTMLLAVVGPDCAIFGQVGDGAIVIGDADTYRTVFWPEEGEYLNATFFISDPKFLEHLQVCALPGELHELALLSDGLQSLALRYADKTAHPPFFQPMFQSLKAAELVDALREPMRSFLDSAAVNQRTDDDKTLILAARVTDSAKSV